VSLLLMIPITSDDVGLWVRARTAHMQAGECPHEGPLHMRCQGYEIPKMAFNVVQCMYADSIPVQDGMDAAEVQLETSPGILLACSHPVLVQECLIPRSTVPNLRRKCVMSAEAGSWDTQGMKGCIQDVPHTLGLRPESGLA
jgi:hypothetical protein